MTLISLTPFDLALASVLVVALAALSFCFRLGLGGRILVAALRTVVQLTLVGLVLKAVFSAQRPSWLALIATVTAFTVTLLALVVVIRPEPWWEAQYAIPLLGMLLGNTMTGVALGMGRLTESAHRDRLVIEQRLLLGQTRQDATRELRQESIRTGMIPILNAMAVAGIVSLPGMMTGQILAGSPPVEAVKYQILIMFLIAAGTGFGVVCSVWLTAGRLFDDRHRLRLERLA